MQKRKKKERKPRTKRKKETKEKRQKKKVKKMRDLNIKKREGRHHFPRIKFKVITRQSVIRIF